MKRVIISENYTSINTTLFLAEGREPDPPATIIIPANFELFKFLREINEKNFGNTLNLIYSEPYRSTMAGARGIRRLLHVPVDIVRERRHLKRNYAKYLAEIQGCEVYFFSRGFSGTRYYLLKKLARRNKLVYVSHTQPSVTPISRHAPGNLAELVALVIMKLTYGRGIAMGKFFYPHGLPFIPDRFMEREVDRAITWEEKEAMMKDFDVGRFRVFDAGKYEAIYFGHEMGSETVADLDGVEKVLTGVTEILLKHFPAERIAMKQHPLHREEKTMIKAGDVLASFIPAEFLRHQGVKVYLSPYSLSITNLTGGKAISLVELIPVVSQERREMLKELLVKQSRTEILFPETLEELDAMLVDAKRQKM